MYMVTCETWTDDDGYAYSQFYVVEADHNVEEKEFGDYRLSVIGYYETRAEALKIANEKSEKQEH